jgi:hypothetical protein
LKVGQGNEKKMSGPVAIKTSEPKSQSPVVTGSSDHGACSGASAAYAGIFRLQRVAGNRAVNQLIQTKLSISTPGDRYEVEADRVADRVMRSPLVNAGADFGITRHTGSNLQRACDKCEEELQRSCDTCSEEERKPSEDHVVQRQAGSAQTASALPNLGSQINAARGSGTSLPIPSRALFEGRFGYDFRQVRIHTGANAASLARSVNARAFTMGRDIFFGANQYSPETSTGQRLVAHELTHVIQQGSGLRLQRATEPSSPCLDSLATTSTPAGGEMLVQRQNLGPINLLTGTLDPQWFIGKAWLILPTSMKAKVIDKAISANLKVVDKFPGVALFGGVWFFIRAGLVGFWEKLKSAAIDLKIKAVDTIARIMAGESPEYSLGMLKGLAKGFFIEGAAGIFIAAWDLLKALGNLWGFFKQIGEAIGGFPQDIKELIKSFEAFAAELLTNIGPAIAEFKTSALDPKKVGEFVTSLGVKAIAFAKQGGERAATALLELFTKKGAEAELGENVGSVLGQVLWEVLFTVVTYGAGAAVTAEKLVIKKATSVLAKVVGKIAGSILKLVKELELIFAEVAGVIKRAFAFIKGKLSAIGGKLGEFLDKVGAFFKKLLSNCHESKLRCKFGKAAKDIGEEEHEFAPRLKTRAKGATEGKSSGQKGGKPDLREINDIAQEHNLDRKKFGQFLEKEKAAGNRGTKNDRGDFTRQELLEKVEEFKAL